MCHGWVKLIIGLWLILSGLLSSLQSPINLMIIGLIAAICCFRSTRLWQAFATGILGLWLFMSGLSFLFIHTHLVTSVNFFISGFVMGILGMWCIIHHSKELTIKTAEL